MFANSNALLLDGLAKFIIKGINRTMRTPAKKHLIFNYGNGLCTGCNKIGNLKHYINCCTNKLTNYTDRYNNVGN
jgi:TATA-box binding protein (TBP) (component of TFIID and TFIIIB)